ncbi:MAG: EAL domain-containing protein [Burkholderiales bacterium]|nr:EAL domain-containing protein [Burkholderiales bacterium]
MSPSIPPNSSSDAAAAQEAEAGGGLGALVGRLAEEFGVGDETLARVASVFAAVHERAPDLFVPAAGALAPAFERAASSGGNDTAPVHAALGEWALDAEGEPIERMRRDCLRFQNAMTRGVLRLQGGDPEQCAESLTALQRFNVLQLALLASLAARSQEGGGVVRTLPTPEYAAFMNIFRDAIDSHREEGRQLGLLLIHVARVEQVDCLLGLQRGEAFMLRVIRRMREGVLRKQDQLGRVSRDQLACLLPRIAGEGVAVLAANKILDALDAPVPIGDRSFPPDAVIGIAVYPDHGTDQQTLVRNGKLAALSVRDTAERFAVYDPAHGASEERRVRYEGRLRNALEEGELALEFLPQLDLRSGRIAALGCVPRWRDAELGEVPEAQLLETAESAGLTREVMWWLFNNALRQGAGFARAGLEVALVLKVGAGGLLQPDFSEFTDRALRTWGVPADRVVIAVHESALTGRPDEVKETLVRLKALGLRLAVDGFGAGSSSLAGLAQLPFDEMILGTEFTTDMLQDARHAKIVDALAHLARNLGLVVAAGDVEDAATAEALQALGCERVQGAYAGAPLAAEEVLAKCVQRH